MTDTERPTSADAARARLAERVGDAADRALLAEAHSTAALRHDRTQSQPIATHDDLHTTGVRRTVARGVIDDAIADANGHRTRRNTPRN